MMHHRVRWYACLFVVFGCLWAAATASANMFPQSVASGDPHPDSVVLWTRLDNPAMPDALQVEVATDEAFQDVVATRDLEAMEQYGWAVKVRIDGLEPYTTYYYRFVYGSGAAMEMSPVGRTKTAPSPDMDVPVRFAVVYCQDYIGRYYNTYAQAAARSRRRHRLRGPPRRLHLRDHRRSDVPGPRLASRHRVRGHRGCDRPRRPGGSVLRSSEPVQLPGHLPHLPDGLRSPAGPRALADDRDLGRPRVLERPLGCDCDLLRRPDGRV